MQAVNKGGSEEFIQALINNGADVDAEYETGKTILEIALLNNWDRIAQLFLKNGASTKMAQPPLVTFAKTKDCIHNFSEDCINTFFALIKREASLNRRDSNRQTVSQIIDANINEHENLIAELSKDIYTTSYIDSVAISREVERQQDIYTRQLDILCDLQAEIQTILRSNKRRKSKA